VRGRPVQSLARHRCSESSTRATISEASATSTSTWISPRSRGRRGSGTRSRRGPAPSPERLPRAGREKASGSSMRSFSQKRPGSVYAVRPCRDAPPRSARRGRRICSSIACDSDQYGLVRRTMAAPSREFLPGKLRLEPAPDTPATSARARDRGRANFPCTQAPAAACASISRSATLGRADRAQCARQRRLLSFAAPRGARCFSPSQTVPCGRSLVDIFVHSVHSRPRWANDRQTTAPAASPDEGRGRSVAVQTRRPGLDVGRPHRRADSAQAAAVVRRGGSVEAVARRRAHGQHPRTCSTALAAAGTPPGSACAINTTRRGDAPGP